MQRENKTVPMACGLLSTDPAVWIGKGLVLVSIFLIALLFQAKPGIAVPPSYSVKDLGTLGGASSEATGINESGQITGWSLAANGHTYAFIYSNGKMTSLGSLGTDSMGYGINNSGQVTGTTILSGGDLHAFRYANGKIKDLGSLGSLSQGLGINGTGYVTGFTSTADGHRAFLYSGEMIDLGTFPEGPYSQGYAINDAVLITGVAGTATGENHAFIFENGLMNDIGTLPGGTRSIGRAINSSGQVAGISDTATGVSHAFLYTDGRMTDLGTTGGYAQSEGLGINSLGHVVGRFTDEVLDEHAFFHNGTRMFDLNALIPPNSGWVLSRANAINKKGQIAGVGTLNGATHAFLLTRTQALTATAGSGGTIAPSGTVMVDMGGSQTFTIKPDTDYRIVSVLIDGADAGPLTSYTFNNISGPHTISATFTKITHFISASAGPEGTILPAGRVEVVHGARQTFTITPSANYHVSSLDVDGTRLGATGTYTFYEVASDHVIHANFLANQHSILATAGPNGSISPSGSVIVAHGASQAFSFTPDANYEIADVTVDSISVGPVSEYTFQDVAKDHAISVAFVLKKIIITASTESSGSITPSGLVPVTFGTDKTFTIKAATNYHVEDVKVDGVSIGPVTSYTFTDVEKEHSISALFNRNQPHTIDASAGANGTISPSGLVSVDYGTSRRFTITPNAKYRIKRIFLDGAPVETANPLVVKNVVRNHSLFVTFERINRRPVPDAGPDQNVLSGSVVRLSAANSTDPDDGIASYLWKQIDGPPVELAPLTSATPGFVAPTVGINGASLSFQVTVTDLSGQKGSTTCIVNVLKPGGKIPPTANAGPDQHVTSGSEVTLDGSGSNDQGQGVLAYKWTQISGPALTIQDPQLSLAGFTAPPVPLGGEQPFFRLMVRYPGGLRSTDTCIVNVTGTDSPPTADAGLDQDNIQFGEIVTLDGLASSDPEGVIDTYRWRQVSGPPVTIVDPTAGQTTFTAPGTVGELVFELTVTDVVNQKAAKTCVVRVTGP